MVLRCRCSSDQIHRGMMVNRANQAEDGSDGSARARTYGREAKHSAERSPWHCCKNKRIANGVYPPRPRSLRFIYDTTEPNAGVASLPAATSSVGDLAPGILASV